MSITSPFDIVADLDTPVSAFLKLHDLQPRFLLESVESGERLARYSFLGFGNAIQIRLDHKGLHIDSKTKPGPKNKKQYLAILRKILDSSPKLKPSINEVPFSGGIVGVSGYDVVRLFENIPKKQSHPKIFLKLFL